MGVCTDIFIKKEQLIDVMDNISVFAKLLQWSGIRWYRFCEKIPNIESYVYHEYFTSDDIKDYLMRSNKKIRDREIFAEITNYDIIFAPDSIGEDFVSQGYVEVSRLYDAMFMLIKKYADEGKDFISEVNKMVSTSNKTSLVL